MGMNICFILFEHLFILLGLGVTHESLPMTSQCAHHVPASLILAVCLAWRSSLCESQSTSDKQFHAPCKQQPDLKVHNRWHSGLS